MSNKGIRKLHELDNTVSYEELLAELEDLQGRAYNCNISNKVINKRNDELQAENAEKDIQISQLNGLYKQNEQLLSDLVAASTLVASHINLSMSQADEIERLKGTAT